MEKFFNKLSALMQEAGETALTPSVCKKIIKLAVKKLPTTFFIDKEDLDLEPELYDIPKLRRRCVERIGVVRKQQKSAKKRTLELQGCKKGVMTILILKLLTL